MVIPSGDLAPLRRHRRYGRRRRSRWPVALAVVAVVGVAGGAYGWQQRSVDDRRASVPRGCASTVASPTTPRATLGDVRLPSPGQVSLRLLNGTGRARLARAVAAELARRGFRVSRTGNAPRALVGASRVYYGPGGRPAALLVSTHVLGSTVVPVSTAARGAVDVVLGSAFARLRTPAETSAYARQLVTAGVPDERPSAHPESSPVCR